MNIVYLIGNGFDLNLRLPTDYKHFYEYYVTSHSTSEIIERLKRHIRNYEDQNWSDLEVGLGEYTAQLSTYKELEEIFINLNLELTKYIQMIDNQLPQYTQSYKDKFLNDLRTPYSYLTSKEQAIMMSHYQSFSSDIYTNIVNFNYTHTIEHITQIEKGKHISIGQYEKRSVYLRPINHLHREIGDRGIILGVNDETQITNQELASDIRAKNLLIKPVCNEQLGWLNDVTCKQRIQGANLLCLFGLSLGKTDRLWWQIIGKHMEISNCHLIYFHYTDKTFPLEQLEINYKLSLKEQLLDTLEIMKNKHENVLSRIFIVINSNMFVNPELTQSIDENFIDMIF